MTTPERLRRRQRFETFLVAVTMALSAATIVTQSHRNDSQDKCLTDSFADLTRTLTIRGQLSTDDTNNLNAIVGRISAAQSEDDVRAAFTDYLEARKKIDNTREKTPIPPYPSGKCD